MNYWINCLRKSFEKWSFEDTKFYSNKWWNSIIYYQKMIERLFKFSRFRSSRLFLKTTFVLSLAFWSMSISSQWKTSRSITQLFKRQHARIMKMFTLLWHNFRIWIKSCIFRKMTSNLHSTKFNKKTTVSFFSSIRIFSNDSWIWSIL